MSGDHIEADGVIESSVNGVIRVALDTGQTINTSLSGKMRRYKIMVIPGDRVRVKISPYDLDNGLVVYRY